MAVIEVKVPNLGDFKDVEIIEVHVAIGDTVKPEGTLITLETDKAAMEVPSTAGGVVKELLVKKGDRVSEGQLIVRLDGEAIAVLASSPASPPAKVPASAAASDPATSPASAAASAAADPSAGRAGAAPAAGAPAPSARAIPDTAATYSGPVDLETELLVLGAGPGGYPAAFRAADLGLKVTLVERWATLGGVCLNVGCIPSKALLHAAKVIDDVEGMADCGLRFGEPQIDMAALRGWKDRTVGKLTGGLAMLAQKRKVDIVRGTGSFLSPYHLEVVDGGQRKVIAFRQCVIAAGSESVRLPGFPDDPRIIDSTGALELRGAPKTMLVVGGGIIGLEMATVYSALGTKISVVELTDGLMPGCDPDLVRPLQRRIAKRYAQIMTGTKVTRIVPVAEGLQVTFEGKTSATGTYDQVLMAVGRAPNGKRLSAEAMEYLALQDFPGNVRQLENLCHWLTVMAPTQTIEVADLPAELKLGGGGLPESDWVGALEREVERAFGRGETAILDKFAQAFETALISKALARTGGRRIEAANLLGMGRNTITRKIQELGLDAKGGADDAA